MNSVVIVIGRYLIFLSVLVAAAFWTRANTREKIALGWRFVVAGLIAEGLAQIAGRVFYDTRPFVTEHLKPLIAHAPDNGFPSDHVLLASLLAFVVALYSRRVGLVLFLIALLIGWARVQARIHHPVDVVGALVLSALAVAIVQVIARLFGARRRPHDSGPSTE
jgi:undecaprenyl-diphosphatase